MAAQGAVRAVPASTIPLDAARAWILGEPPAYDDEPGSPQGTAGSELPMARMLPAPEEPMESRQRVLRICLGAEHGILLTDAGVACTWGDNRYGQLGRRPCRKEEDDQPYPVLNLQTEEISQVAAGRHHCLALTASGLVWAWGRNKAGQLGCGDFRDKVFPEKVCVVTDEQGVQPLGYDRNDKRAQIITIGAGNNSSVAAALNSDVWQWGEISENFKKKEKDRKGRTSKQENQSLRPNNVLRNRPHRVFENGMYRSGLRQDGKVSVSELGCRVLSKAEKDSAEAQNRLKDLVESVRQLQVSINKERREIAEIDEKLQATRERRSKNGGEGDGNDQRSLQETIATIELEISQCDRDISLLEKNQQSCDMQQTHNRSQLQSLMAQGTRLSNKQDEYVSAVLLAQRGSTDRNKKEEKLAQVKDFVEANQNTRMTLLDQLAETDKEKQRISSQLQRTRDRREQIKRRLETVRDLGRSASESSGQADRAMKFLKEKQQEIANHFQGRQVESAFVEAKQALERDNQFLSNIEQKVKEMVATAPVGNAPRSQKVQLMLQDIIDLRRAYMSMDEDRWVSEDLDMKCFFQKKEKPETVDVPLQELPALADADYMQGNQI